ncbi:hypothetical protein ACETIH_08805 [Microvirga arabica]|uniref:Uncharacterized protein n=1 Tax=Microvirga arabica TaxID=1128671 RepID=A0ABV6Y715_9HYPH
MARICFNGDIREGALPDLEGEALRNVGQAWELTKAMARNLIGTAFEQSANCVAAYIELNDDVDGIILEFPSLGAIPLMQQSR